MGHPKSSAIDWLRFGGVRDFLRARSIDLPESPEDAAPGLSSVQAVGNRKNELVNQLLRDEGVEPFPGSVALLRRVRELGLKTAVVTSSNNCDAVLSAATIQDLFEAKVDADVATRRSLAGKPAPDTFLEGARELSLEPARVVVVEDLVDIVP